MLGMPDARYYVFRISLVAPLSAILGFGIVRGLLEK